MYVMFLRGAVTHAHILAQETLDYAPQQGPDKIILEPWSVAAGCLQNDSVAHFNMPQKGEAKGRSLTLFFGRSSLTIFSFLSTLR